ncbi:hypothetical protein [Streptomyces jumonjinensis]
MTGPLLPYQPMTPSVVPVGWPEDREIDGGFLIAHEGRIDLWSAVTPTAP